MEQIIVDTIELEFIQAAGLRQLNALLHADRLAVFLQTMRVLFPEQQQQYAHVFTTADLQLVLRIARSNEVSLIVSLGNVEDLKLLAWRLGAFNYQIWTEGEQIMIVPIEI